MPGIQEIQLLHLVLGGGTHNLIPSTAVEILAARHQIRECASRRGCTPTLVSWSDPSCHVCLGGAGLFDELPKNGLATKGSEILSHVRPGSSMPFGQRIGMPGEPLTADDREQSLR